MLAQKILVLGPYGAGKTNFSNELSTLLKIPVFHLDRYYWLSNWQTPKLDKWIAINRKLTMGKTWILDGNYIKTLDIRINEADLIIYLDINRWRSLYRIIKRTLLNLGKRRADLPEGCTDNINLRFFLSVLFFNEKIKPLILRKIEMKQCQRKLIVHRSDAKSFKLKYLQYL